MLIREVESFPPFFCPIPWGMEAPGRPGTPGFLNRRTVGQDEAKGKGPRCIQTPFHKPTVHSMSPPRLGVA